uniref:hypothetical protein n=1 Tax=Herbidospora sakaeratensis TaxID=564415 RepID=UPI000784846A|nr:hypothetical protein [Herbidospora sakaeratensis]
MDESGAAAEEVEDGSGPAVEQSQKLFGVACGLCADPAVLFLDEPLAGVSPHTADALQEVVPRLRAGGRTLVIIEHNSDLVSTVSDTVVVMESSLIGLGAES